jgi:CheY-like chemotaxis protein
VQAESRGLGTGATFRITLPVATQPAPEANAPLAPSLVSRRVLLVEDDVDAMETSTQLLHLMGHQVTQARNHAEVLKAAQESALVDVVVMDLGLPGKDGCQIAIELRRLDTMRTVPMIALTGYGQEADRARALAAGFNEHLTKPVDPATLMRIIDELTRKSHA